MEGRQYKNMSRAVESGVAAFLATPPWAWRQRRARER